MGRACLAKAQSDNIFMRWPILYRTSEGKIILLLFLAVLLILGVYLGEINCRANYLHSFAWLRIVRVHHRCCPPTRGP